MSTLVWVKMFEVKTTSLNKVTCGDDFTFYMTEIIYQLGGSTQMQKEAFPSISYYFHIPIFFLFFGISLSNLEKIIGI